MNFYRIARSPDTLAWMKNELLFTDQDLGTSRPANSKSFLSNLDYAYKIMKSRCRNGSLKLDLNLEDYVPGVTITATTCD